MTPDEREEAEVSEKTATTVKDWKKGSGAHPLKVPSGNTALVKRRSLEAFAKAGLIPNSLLPTIRKVISGEKKVLNAEDIEWTDGMIQDVLILIDLVVVECVVEPRVHAEPPCALCQVPRHRHREDQKGENHSFTESERDPEKLYVDEVDFADRQHIYQWVILGVEDFNPFRPKPEGDVDGLPDGEDVSDETEQSVSS